MNHLLRPGRFLLYSLLLSLLPGACTGTRAVWPSEMKHAVLEPTRLEQARADVERLASRDMAGRGYSMGGHLKAAEYIAARFRSIGLIAPETGYLQPFPVVVDTFMQKPTFRLGYHDLRFGEDFIINPGNAEGSATDIPVVDCGAGRIPTTTSIAGALAVIDPDRSEGNDQDETEESTDSRIEGLIDAGAAAVAVLTDRPTYGHFGEEWQVPVIHLSRDAYDRTANTASFSVRISHDVDITTNNVLGYLPGKSDRDSGLLVCAHYDHLGQAGPDGPYFPGANDNASGTALMLALADHFSKHPASYPIIFVAFSGEEIGLKGSINLAEGPPIRLTKIRFLLNTDMAASGTDGVMVMGAPEFPKEFNLLKTIHAELNLPDLRDRVIRPISDHAPFLYNGVRGFYVYPFTGHQPYHHVRDVPETLQWETFRGMLALTAEFLERIP